jgi:hypothetical protein
MAFYMKTIMAMLLLGIVLAIPAMAKGDVDIYLRCDSPSYSIRRALGNNTYAGEEKRYTWQDESVYYDTFNEETIMSKRISANGYVDVFYRDVKPYVLREDLFKANPNYYRAGVSGSGSDGWWIFSDSESAEYPPRQYHQYASVTTGKSTAVTGISYGQIKLTYKRFDGTAGEKVINVQIQKRDCEAYNNGKWREVSPGRWEMQ